MAAYFNIFLIVMALLALAVYIALHYFEAGYGISSTVIRLPDPETGSAGCRWSVGIHRA
ncbi:MAG: hypothetical protein ACLVJK_12305 [Alistipes putredinis]